MNRNKILIIGPMPEPTTGVSLANKVVYDNIKNHENYQANFINTSYTKFNEDLGGFSFSKIWFYLKLNLYSYKILNSKIVYLTPGQTFFGVLKYTLFLCLAKLLNKEIVLHIHGNHLGKEYGALKGLKKKMFKFLIGLTSKGIVLSESLVGNMTPFISADKIYVLYNFVEDYLFLPRDFSVNNSDKLRVVFLSNLMEEKGVFDLLEALQVLEDKNTAYEAKIAGAIDEKFESVLQSKFKSLKNTEYVGVVRGEQKRELLIWSNVFILPTYYTMEGQPISILEAMATGNVILTTKHAGIPDVFKPSQNGYYVDKRNSNSIAENLISLNKNRSILDEIGTSNIKEAHSKYEVSNFINKFAHILNA